jgi:hypothetical protein
MQVGHFPSIMRFPRRDLIPHNTTIAVLQAEGVSRDALLPSLPRARGGATRTQAGKW